VSCHRPESNAKLRWRRVDFRGKAEGRKPAQPSIPEGILGFPSL
jgi:hypothetical protein